MSTEPWFTEYERGDVVAEWRRLMRRQIQERRVRDHMNPSPATAAWIERIQALEALPEVPTHLLDRERPWIIRALQVRRRMTHLEAVLPAAKEAATVPRQRF